MRRHHRILFIFLLMLCPGTYLVAQTSSQLDLEFTYDGNAFRTSDPVSDFISQASFYLARDFDSDRFISRLFYAGSLNFSTEETDRRSHDHQFGISSNRSLGDDGDMFNFGGNFTISRQSYEFDFTDYTQELGFLSLKLRSGDNRIYQVGGRLKHRSYADLTAFTHTEGLAYGRISFFLSSRTSVILFSNFGVKDYRGFDEVSDSTTEDSSHGHGSGGKGRGGSEGGIVGGSTSSAAHQLIGSVTIGQSVMTSTGLSLTYTRQVNTGDDRHPLYPVSEIWYYRPDDELSDDPYSYEGHEVNVAVTRLLPYSSQAKIGYDFSRRHYLYEALDIEGEPLPDGRMREDHRHVFWVHLEKTFHELVAHSNIQVFLDFAYLDNDSNDSYFHYIDRVFSLGTSLSF